MQGSASVQDGNLCVTAVNSHPTQAVELELDVRQATLGTMELTTLAADDIHAHNTFAQPDAVRPSAPSTVQADGSRVRVTLPAAAVVRLMGRLGG